MGTVVYVCGLLLIAATPSSQCDQCDCNISGGDEIGGVHVAQLTCQTGSVTWYNPIGALRLEFRPEKMAKFTGCFVVDSGDVMLKISQEVDVKVNSKSPTERSRHVLNDNNLKTVLAGIGRSREYCLSTTTRLVLYLEPEVTPMLGTRKIHFQYDMTTNGHPDLDTSIEDCRPCSHDEILAAYCSSDFVVVGKMDNVQHFEEKTHIGVVVTQIVRQVGSHFTRAKRESPELQGTITVPRKCGVVKGDGLFLMTGRERLGELRMGCAPYLHDWEIIVNEAERDGRMQCTRE